MLGAIIGDIVGSRWEFNPTNDYDFEWLSDENGFTDDTICTVAVADALLKGRDFGKASMSGVTAIRIQWEATVAGLPSGYEVKILSHITRLAMGLLCV